MNRPSFLDAWLYMTRKPLSIPELCLVWRGLGVEEVGATAEGYAKQGMFLKLDRPDGVHYALPGADYLKQK